MTFPKPSPEFLLLHLSARMGVNNQAESQISELLKNSVDWEAFRELVFDHRVVPLVYRTFRNLGGHQIPAEVMADLQREYQVNSTRSLFLTRELFKVIDIFAASSIPVIPIKGPVLAQTIYGDIGLRQFDDLDVLIPEDHVVQAHVVLRTHGFKPVLDFDDESKMRLIMAGGKRGFRTPDNLHQLDLHWRVFGGVSRQQLDALNLWEQPIFLELSGRQIKNLPMVIMLIQTCVHGMEHLWSRRQWLVDLVQVVGSMKRTELESAYTVAQELKKERSMHVALILAHRWDSLEIPSTIHQRATHDQQSKVIADQIIRNWSVERPAIRAKYKEFGLQLKVRNDFRTKFGYLRDQFFMPSLEDLATVDLTRKLSFLYYVLRPFRLLLKYFDFPSSPEMAQIESPQDS